MQNFTFGRRGTNLFLFAFVLMLGSLPSYGQDACPTVDDDQQVFCDSQDAEVADLEATAAEDSDVAWYESEDATEPLPDTTLLINGTYYAGTSDQNCEIPVEVTVYTAPEVLGVTEGSRQQEDNNKQSLGSLTICVSDEDNPDVTVGELRTSADDGDGTVNWYLEGSDEVLDPDTPLQDNTYYEVSQTAPDAECETTRNRTLVQLDSEEAPEGDEEQEFCSLDNPTLGDIEATGNNRYYATATSDVRISANEPLVNGETYWVSTLGETCESTDRLAVTVTLTENTVEETQTFCAPGEDGSQPTVGDLSPQGTWYADDTFDTPLENDEELIEGEDYYHQNPEDCEITVVTAEFSDPPNAGENSEVTFCESDDEPVNLVDFIDGDPDENGSFDPPLENNEFIPSEYDPGEYTFTYIVEGDDICPADEAQITVTVEEGPHAGEDIEDSICSSELDDESALMDRFSSYLEGRDEGEVLYEDQSYDVQDFSDLLALGNALNNDFEDGETNFSLTYTVTDEDTGCEDSAEISLTIEESPDAGDDFSEEFCYTQEELPSREEFIALFEDEISGDPDGDFNPSLSDLADDFENNPYDTFSTTFTVSADECEDSAELSVTFTEPVEANAGADVEITFCSTDGPQDLNDFLSEDAITGGSFEGLEDGNFDPATADLGETTITYTVNEENDCVIGEDSATLTITVLEGPDAGDDGSVEFTREDEPVNLFAYLEGTPDEGGTWSPGDEEGEFDPATGTAGNYTYTVTNDNDCEDSAVVNVSFSDEPIDECPEVTETEQAFCESIGEGNDSRRPRIFDLMPADATWYASADAEEALPADTVLEDGATYFAGNPDSTCEDRDSVTVILDDSPNAGRTTNITVCEGDEPFDLLDRFNESNLGAPDEGGTISPALESGTTIFDPAVDEARRYTYTVESNNEACPDDSAFITVNIEDAVEAEAGDDVELEFCSNDDDQDLFSFLSEDANTGGYFEGYEDGIFSPSEEGAGSYEISYVVNDEAPCVVDEGEDTAVFSITVHEAPNAGDDVALEYCITEIEDMTDEEVLAIFTSLTEDRDEGGEFSEAPEDLFIEFSTNPIGTFSTTYTVSNNGCEDSAELSLTITDAEEANAGDDVEVTFCSTDGPQDLEEFLSEDAIPGGSFEGLEGSTFDPSTADLGETTITYTVNEEEACVTGEDSATITITVLEGPNAGDDASVEFSREDDPVNLFDFLGGDPEEGGSWDPGNEDGSFDPATGTAGDYTYTIANDECEGSAVVSVSFTDDPIEECPEVTDAEQTFCESIGSGNDSRRPRVSDLLPGNAAWYASADAEEPLASDTVLEDGETYFAGNPEGTCEDRDSVTVTLDDSPNAGATTNLQICRNDESFDIVDVMNESVLGQAEAGGTISPALESGTTIFDPSVDEAGQYIYTVSSTNEACPDDEARITISFIESEDAGEDMTLEFCPNTGDQNLFDFLSAEASTSGEFFLNEEVIEDGIIDPAEFEPATYEIEYFVEADDECGEDSALFTITINELPDAPDAPEINEFCAVQLATGADLPTSEGQTWYVDADLTTMVIEDDLLESQTYYLTITEDCESNPTEVNVVVNDPPAPTISASSFEFCEFDDVTIADLNDEIVESGEVTWYDSEEGTNALGTSTSLTSGTYYATLTDSDTGCESLQRLPVSVTIEECPIEYPEGISPNGDGLNDTFLIRYLEDEFPNYSIEIFNRWGNVIYKGNASTPPWDGTSNQSGAIGDDVLPVGVYFYVIDFNDGSTEPRQGKVYLSR